MIVTKDMHNLAMLGLMDVFFDTKYIALDCIPQLENETVVQYKLELYAFSNRPQRDEETFDLEIILLWDTKSDYKKLTSWITDIPTAVRFIKSKRKASWKLEEFVDLYK
jgi:hypothetical protein